MKGHTTPPTKCIGGSGIGAKCLFSVASTTPLSREGSVNLLICSFPLVLCNRRAIRISLRGERWKSNHTTKKCGNVLPTEDIQVFSKGRIAFFVADLIPSCSDGKCCSDRIRCFAYRLQSDPLIHKADIWKGYMRGMGIGGSGVWKGDG